MSQPEFSEAFGEYASENASKCDETGLPQEWGEVMEPVPYNDVDGKRNTRLARAVEILCKYNLDGMPGACESVANFLESLYVNNYRHQYSAVTESMYRSISSQGVEWDGVPQEIARLDANCALILETIRGTERTKDSRDFVASVTKLRDHVHLEYVRMELAAKQNRELIDARDKIEQAVQKSEDSYNTLKKRVKKAREKASAMQRETVAVLGIFAAAVLVFNGSMGFANSSIVALGTASGLGALFLMVLIDGFVLVNAIGLLCYFILVITQARDGEEEPRFACIIRNVLDFVNVLFAFAIVFMTCIFIACCYQAGA